MTLMPNSELDMCKMTRTNSDASETPIAYSKGERKDGLSCCSKQMKERLLEYARRAVFGAKGVALAILVAILFAQVYFIFMISSLK